MYNIRLRIQMMVALNTLFLFAAWLLPDTTNETGFFRNFVLFCQWAWVAVVATVILDSVLSSYYLDKIAKFSRNIGGKTLMALRDASVFRLRKIALQEAQETTKLMGQIEALFLRAKAYPNLYESKEFQKAVYGFKFEKAKGMLLRAERSAKYAVEEANRSERRGQNKIWDLIEEATSLGLGNQDIYSMDVVQLRDLINQTKEWRALVISAKDLGCRTFVEQFGWQEKEKAKSFLIRVEYFISEAKLCDVEDEVREFVSYGNLESAEKLISTRKKEAEFFGLKKTLQIRINSLPTQYQASRQKLLDVFCEQPFNCRAYHKALHDLEKSLKECEV